MRRHDPNYDQDYFENTMDGRVTWTPQRLDSDLTGLSDLNLAGPQVEGEGDDTKKALSTDTTRIEKFRNFFDLSRINLSRDGMVIEERAKRNATSRLESSPL